MGHRKILKTSGTARKKKKLTFTSSASSHKRGSCCGTSFPLRNNLKSSRSWEGPRIWSAKCNYSLKHVCKSMFVLRNVNGLVNPKPTHSPTPHLQVFVTHFLLLEHHFLTDQHTGAVTYIIKEKLTDYPNIKAELTMKITLRCSIYKVLLVVIKDYESAFDAV